MNLRTQILPGVYLTAVQSDKFKTGCFSLNLLRPMKKEEAAANALIPSVLLRGSEQHPDIASISAKLDDLYGASIGTLIRKKGEVQMVGFYCDYVQDEYVAERVFAPVMEFLAELLLRPRLENGVFSEAVVESEKLNLENAMLSRINDKRSYANSQLIRTMCDGEPYGIARIGEPEDLKTITAESLYAHYRDILASSRVELFYMGSLPSQTVTQILQKALRELPRAAAFVPVITTPAPAARPIRTKTERLDVTQGKLSLGFFTDITAKDPRYPALVLAATVFGGGATSKLFTKVREEMSLCYYAGASFEKFKGVMVVSSGVEFSKLETAEQEILRQLDACRNAQITDEELESARGYLVSDLKIAMDSPGRLDDFYMGQILLEQDGTMEELADAIARVSKEEAAQAAGALRLDTIYELRGGAGVIRKDFPRLGEHYFEERLENGLLVRVMEKPGFAKRYAFVAADYGSIDAQFIRDGRKITTPLGVAHYLEHKMFDLPEGNAMQAFAKYAGANNAFTSYTMTAYYVECTEHFEENLEILLRMVTTGYFTPESVEKERGIIAQEIKMYDDSADSAVMENLFRIMYRNHPVREPIAGTVESIQDITADTLKLCHDTFYDPSNLILCVIGDVNAAEVIEQARRQTPQGRRMQIARCYGEPEPQNVQTRRTEKQMEISMPAFVIGFRCPDAGRGAQAMRAELIGELAGEILIGESSALYQKLYDENVIDAAFSVDYERMKGMALLELSGDSEQPERILREVLEEARRVTAAGVDRALLARLKKSVTGRRLRELDGFEGTCYRMCAYYFDGAEYFDYPEIYESVTAEDVEQFIRENVKEEGAFVSVITPKREEEAQSCC